MNLTSNGMRRASVKMLSPNFQNKTDDFRKGEIMVDCLAFIRLFQQLEVPFDTCWGRGRGGA